MSEISLENYTSIGQIKMNNWYQIGRQWRETERAHMYHITWHG